MNIRRHDMICDYCKFQSTVSFYFCDTEIITHQSGTDVDIKEYEASVKAKAICPYCGTINQKQYKRIINNSDIIEMVMTE